MKLKPGARAIMDGILTMPLVLPPTVAGFCLLLLFSLKRPFGKFLLQNFDIKVVQTWTGCVIAASVIAFPLMYRNARAAFEQVDVNLIYAGRTLGMSESRIFWKVIMPAAGTWNRIRYRAGFCPCNRRIRRYLHACRQHSWKNKDSFSCHRFRDSSWKL